jgi:hypothetical protein
LSLLPASPFPLPGSGSIGSFAAYPARSCGGLQLSIVVDPKDDDEDANSLAVINLKSKGQVRVAVLSSSTFDATTQLDTTSLTFGHSGTENSVVACGPEARDVNLDGFPDLVCRFSLPQTGFQPGDTQAVLHAKTLSGTSATGTASIQVVH